MEIRTILMACLIELEHELSAQHGADDVLSAVPRELLAERFTARNLTREDFDVDLTSALMEGDVVEPAPGMLRATSAGSEHYRRMVKGTAGPGERA